MSVMTGLNSGLSAELEYEYAGWTSKTITSSTPGNDSRNIIGSSSIIKYEIGDYGRLDAEEMFVADLLTNNGTFWIMVMIIVGLLSIWFIYNGIMLLFDLKAPSWKPGLVIFISWVIGIFIFAGYVAKLAADALGTLLLFI